MKCNSIIWKDGKKAICGGRMVIIGQKIKIPYCYHCDDCDNIVYL